MNKDTKRRAEGSNTDKTKLAAMKKTKEKRKTNVRKKIGRQSSNLGDE